MSKIRKRKFYENNIDTCKNDRKEIVEYHKGSYWIKETLGDFGQSTDTLEKTSILFFLQKPEGIEYEKWNF